VRRPRRLAVARKQGCAVKGKNRGVPAITVRPGAQLNPVNRAATGNALLMKERALTMRSP